MAEKSSSEFRRVAMTLSKRDLVLVSDLLMIKGLVAAQQGDTKEAERYDALSLEAWLLAAQ